MENDLSADLMTFVRNRYFYSKRLDVIHFEREQDYFNRKRWMLNRLVTGYGVICGLNVGLTEDGSKVWVDRGVALDRAGREIVVPVRSEPVELPKPEPPPAHEAGAAAGEGPHNPGQEYYHHERVVSVYLCFLECPGDPEPVLADDCDGSGQFSNGSIRERYRIEFRPDPAPRIDVLCEVPDLISQGQLNYPALASYVTSNSPELNGDPCIPLANIRIPPGDQPPCGDDVDISVRPIVYTNDLLFELLLGLTTQTPQRRRGGK